MGSGGSAAIVWDTGFAGLLRFPYRRFTIDSQLPLQAAIGRLRGIVHQSSFALTELIPSGKLFVGDFTPAHFKLFRITPYSPRSGALIVGSAAPTPNGSRLDITMRLPRNNQVGAMLWFGIASALLCACVLGPMLSTHMSGSASFAGFMVLMIAAGYTILALGFNRDADASEALLREALQLQPSQRIKEALAPDPAKLRARQIKTARAVVIVAIAVAIFAFLAVPASLQRSEKFRVAQHFVENDPTVLGELGNVTSVEPYRWRGLQETTSGEEGSAKFSLNVRGTGGHGVVSVEMRKHQGVWTVASAKLYETGGRTVALGPNRD